VGKKDEIRKRFHKLVKAFPMVIWRGNEEEAKGDL
jgi:hypothetical protein